jgi:hypothetical protein
LDDNIRNSGNIDNNRTIEKEKGEKGEFEEIGERMAITKIGASEEQNQWINYAYNRCGIDCVKTWEGESGWRLNIVSKPNTNGTKDYSLCQLNSQYHWDFINSEAIKDPYKVLDYCIAVWNDAKKKGRLKTTFYAYNVRNTPGINKRFSISK